MEGLPCSFAGFAMNPYGMAVPVMHVDGYGFLPVADPRLMGFFPAATSASPPLRTRICGHTCSGGGSLTLINDTGCCICCPRTCQCSTCTSNADTRSQDRAWGEEFNRLRVWPYGRGHFDPSVVRERLAYVKYKRAEMEESKRREEEEEALRRKREADLARREAEVSSGRIPISHHEVHIKDRISIPPKSAVADDATIVLKSDAPFGGASFSCTGEPAVSKKVVLKSDKPFGI